MRQFVKANKILILLICVFLIAALIPIGNRIGIEKKNKTYDIVVDYNELVNMADQSHDDVTYWLQQFRDELDITKVGLAEESIVSLMESSDMPVSGNVMDQITKEADWQSQYPAEFIAGISEMGYDSFDVVIETGNAESSDFVLNAIQQRFQPEQYFALDLGDKVYIMVDGDSQNALYSEKVKLENSNGKGFVEKQDVISSKILYVSLGLMPEKVKDIQDLGMQVVPRTTCYSGFNDNKFASAVVDGYEKYGITPEYIIASGSGVFGYDDGIEFARDYIASNDVTIGLIENTTQLQNILQDGVFEIASSTDFNAVRVFSVWDYIQYRYQYYGYEGAKEIENTLFRAVTERNIRLIYYKPIKSFEDSYTYITDIEEYKTLFTNLRNRLADHGFTYGSASVMDYTFVAGPLKLAIAFGCVAAAVLLLATIFPMKRKLKLLIGALGLICVCGAYVVIPGWFELILSFASAVVFACLAIVLYTAASKSLSDKCDENTPLAKIIGLAAAALTASVLIALAGGMMTAAPLAGTTYMLEIDIFRGVKLAQLLPIAFFAVAYLAYFGFGDKKTRPGVLEIHDLKDMFNTNIKVWMIFVVGCAGLVGVYYILRTGHDSSLEVASFEMLFRNYLEENLIARPRTKEILFAFPAIVMMVYTAARKFRIWTIIFGLCGVIGMTSVCNTFMHFRTPLYLGFARTAYSFIGGLVIGIIGILVFEAAYRLYRKYLKSYLQ